MAAGSGSPTKVNGRVVESKRSCGRPGAWGHCRINAGTFRRRLADTQQRAGFALARLPCRFMLETAMLASFLIASAGQNQSALIAVTSALAAIIFTKAVDWFFERSRRFYERKQIAAAITAELEAVLQIFQMRQYQNILASFIDSMTKTGKAANPRIPIRENIMPV